MAQVQYEEVRCKEALSRVTGMPFRWSLNPYRGCVHGCHYCFARRFHYVLELDPSADFAGLIFVKVNAPEALALQVSAPSWRREQVAIGTATDPYQPIEGKYRLTRRCLEVLASFRTPASIVTKGTMVVRDVDVLTDLARRAGSTVCFSVPTLDADLWRRLEPGTPPPWQRLRAMERLATAGVHVGVLMAPVVPLLTDGRASMEQVARAAADHGARFLGANVMYLKEGTREHFLGFLAQEYPELLDAYRQLYPGYYAPRRLQERVHAAVQALREDVLAPRLPNPGPDPTPPRQLALLAPHP